MFSDKYYPPTNEVRIYTDLTTILGQYVEIGSVEAKGGTSTSKQTLLDDMKAEAKRRGADALIKVEFYDRERFDPDIGSYSKAASKAVMIRFTSTIPK